MSCNERLRASLHRPVPLCFNFHHADIPIANDTRYNPNPRIVEASRVRVSF